MRRISQHADPWVDLASALVSQAAANGHTCLDLAAARLQTGPDSGMPISIPMEIEPHEWQQRLSACAAVGSPGQFRPLILNGTRLYLHRYWTYEQYVAQSIQQRSRMPGWAGRLNRVAGAAADRLGLSDEVQLHAACMGATRAFVAICGGPGTGKTFVLARIILLLQYLAADKPLRIELCAPTGKAAVRLQEAMETAFQELPVDQSQALGGLGKARTIHRMLGPKAAGGNFRYHAGHPLPADVVIVDEASMIDLALMARLMQALGPATRLILSGDKDQLASVEAGSIWGDICHGAAGSDLGASANDQVDPKVGLKNQIVVLQTRHRFDEASGISELGQAVNRGDAEGALAMLTHGKFPGIKLRSFATWGQLADVLEQQCLGMFSRLCGAEDPLSALIQLRQYQILTVMRNGPYGMRALNAYVQKVLAAKGRIARSPQDPEGWYAGRPVMVVRNDYYHNLFNGDMGIAMAQEASFQGTGRLAVFFADGQGVPRSLSPHQLPPHETAYAMTVHKSQGSEFERVVLILPDRDVPVLTRELIYTAITRARQSVEIWGDARLLAAAVRRRVVRASGLLEALWGTSAHP